MNNFVASLYDYDYSGVNNEESSDEEEAAIVSYTDSSIEEEEEEVLHVDVNFDEPIDLGINWFFFELICF